MKIGPVKKESGVRYSEKQIHKIHHCYKTLTNVQKCLKRTLNIRSHSFLRNLTSNGYVR